MDRHDTDPAGTPRPRIRTQTDLELLWRTLLRPLGFDRTSLWVMLVDADGLAVPGLVEVDDLPEVPGEEDVRALAAFLEEVARSLVPDGSVAMLRSRPGRGRPGPQDLHWARALLDACAAAGVRAEVVHLAHDDDVVPLPLDALVLRRPA